MAAREDRALLRLIFQHLKGNGFTKAARVLEKHLPQVEAPAAAESLHDIYTGWMKSCSLAQHAEQETDDGLNNKSIKVEFIAREEDAAVPKLCGISGEDEVKAKLQSECESVIVECSHSEKNPESPLEPQRDVIPSVQSEESDGESSDTEVEEEKMKEELTNIKQEASAKEVAEVRWHEEKVCPDIQDTVTSSQPESGQALDGEATEEDEAEASKELITNSSTSEVPDEAPASEKMDFDLAKAPGVLDEEPSALEPTELIFVDLTEAETNDRLVESQAPPPAEAEKGNGGLLSHVNDCATEKPKDEEEEVEHEEEKDDKSETVGGADIPSELNPDAAAEKSTAEASDLLTSGLDVVEEPDVSIILNIQTDCDAVQQESSQSLPEESSESCADSKTPKKKKKRIKRNVETPVTDAPSTSASDPSDTPPTGKSSRKKKRHQKRSKDDQEKEEDAAEEVEEEVIPVAASEKKKAKKRKRDKEAVDTAFETETSKTRVKDIEEEENTPAETTEKSKKKKRKKEKEVPSEEAPAEGDEETPMENIGDGSAALLFSGKKKKHLCRKLSLRTRPRFHGKKEKMRKMMKSLHSRQKLMGKNKQKEATLDGNPVKRSPADHETEIKPPKRKKKMKIFTEQEESSVKENEPPVKEKKSMKTKAKIRVGEEFPEEDSSLLSNEGKKKKKRKKKKKKDENAKKSSASADVSQPPLSKKKKKSSLKAGMEDADSHTPAGSAKKKKSSS